jgi:Domain of unknown function (DUF4203)
LRQRCRAAGEEVEIVDLQAIIVGLLAILMGLAFVFVGFQLFLVLLPIWGFFMGFFFGAEIVAAIFGHGFLADVTGWLLGFIVGLIFAVISYLWYWLAVTVLGASVGYAVGIAFVGFLGITNGLINVTTGIIVAVIFALIAIWLRLPKYLAIVLTAAGGAFAAITGLAILFGKIKLDTLGTTGATLGAIQDLSWLWLAAAVILTVIGIVWQTRATTAIETYTYTHYRNPGTGAAAV